MLRRVLPFLFLLVAFPLAAGPAVDDSVEIHELTHALQDQRFGAGARDLALMKDTDAGMAYHSLLEGEASVVMLAYVMAKNGVSLDTIAKNESLVGQMTNATAAAD